MSVTPELTPGTIVKFKNLIQEAELNGQHGVIKKRLSEDAYRVMLGINTKTDFSIKTKNMISQVQCLNERRSNFTAVIIWPEIACQEYPILQWLDWPLAKQNLKVWVEELLADKKNVRMFKPAVFDCEKRDKMFEHSVF